MRGNIDDTVAGVEGMPFPRRKKRTCDSSKDLALAGAEIIIHSHRREERADGYR